MRGACSLAATLSSQATYILDSVHLGVHAWDMIDSHGIIPGTAYPTTNRMLDFMWPYRLSQLCPGGGCGPPSPPPPPGCRADICGDIGNDCCAPGAELRQCREVGYVAVPGGTSSYGECLSRFDESAIYQCCPA